MSWAAELIEMDGAWADDPQQVEGFQAYLARLADRDFAPEESGLVERLPADLPPGYRMAGTHACRACHEEDCELWDASGHGHAWDSLKAQGKQVDPFCQQCHTTGYGLPGGFASIGGTPLQRNVGCESCHGPSLMHVEDTSRRTPYNAKDQCVRCHDQENSPHFDYAPYWAKIHHGDVVASASTGSTGERVEEAQP
jgi:hypothetical protein